MVFDTRGLVTRRQFGVLLGAGMVMLLAVYLVLALMAAREQPA